MSASSHPKADIVPFTKEYSGTVRAWIDSAEVFKDVCRGKNFPPATDIVDTWQRKDVSSYLLFTGGKPVAYAELWSRPNEMAVEVAHLIVDPARRSQGYGSRLLQLLYEQGAARQDVAKIVAHLYSDNRVALGCLLKGGFELAGTTGYTQGLRVVRLVT
ncbi:MAG: GNAT family N-acetyltransferase [Candidatus Zixiibacteriota bacterium]|nr:MAG: GNAT family N-acetyltransferase [candidate division Zixibacteria bacterium]